MSANPPPPPPPIKSKQNQMLRVRSEGKSAWCTLTSWNCQHPNQIFTKLYLFILVWIVAWVKAHTCHGVHVQVRGWLQKLSLSCCVDPGGRAHIVRRLYPLSHFAPNSLSYSLLFPPPPSGKNQIVIKMSPPKEEPRSTGKNSHCL